MSTARGLPSLAEAGVQLDALVASARDPGEQYSTGDLDPPPRHVVRTAGAVGGEYETLGGETGRWGAAELPGPIGDAYGCGDSFAAGLTYGLGTGLTIGEAALLAAPLRRRLPHRSRPLRGPAAHLGLRSRHHAVGRFEREPALLPGEQAAGEIVGLVARGPEGLCGQRGARTRAAVEHHGAVAIDRARLARQPIELDVLRAFDVSGRVLVVLAHVDQLGPLGHQLGGSAGRDLFFYFGGFGQPNRKVAQDPTSRTDSEQVVRPFARPRRGAKSRFQRIVDDAADGFYLCARDGEIVDVNESAAASLGYAREELLAMTVFDVVTTSTPAAFERFWDPSFLLPATVEGIHRRKDGSTFPVETRVAMMESEGEQLLLALARDSRDGWKPSARCASRPSCSIRSTPPWSRRTSTASSPTGTRARPADRLDRRVTRLGRRAEELEGFGPRAAATLPDVRARVAQGHNRDVELRLTRRDGSRFDAYLTATPVRDDDGELLGMVGWRWT